MSEIEYQGDDPELKSAMLAKLKAETRYELAKARREEEWLKQTKLKTAEDLRDERNSAAIDLYHHVFRFTGMVEPYKVSQAVNTLSYWKRLTPGPYEIILNTPGGSVFDGMELFDYIKQLESEGLESTTTIRGMAASMGAILSQAGTRRRMGRNALMLIHRPSTMASGEVGAIEDTLVILNAICDRVVDEFITRSRDAEQPLSEAEFRAKWERKDWTLTADEALRHGFVDEIV